MTGSPGADPPPIGVTVRVPATSANLGPGFDTFGLALGMYDEVDAAVSAGGLSVEVSGEAADDVPRDESHLVVSSMLAALRRWYGEPPGLQVRCRNAIPHSRGLGSSAAAIVAGVTAAKALVDEHAPPRTRVGGDEVLGLATELEGHPDNVAAALGGGFALAWFGGDGVRSVRLRPHDDVMPVVCIPDQPMSTATARGLLPEQVPHQDAVFNATRSGLLVAALTQHPDRLLEATEDRLHQPYRMAAMPATGRLLSHLRAQGIAAVVSGAGPTVLALCDGRRQTASDVAAAADDAAGDATDGTWRVEALGVDLTGVTVQRLAGGLSEPANRRAEGDVGADHP